MALLTIDTAKNVKGIKAGYLTGVLFLAPYKESGCMNTCPHADGCEKTCLNTSGRLRFTTAERARMERTFWFVCDRPGFIRQLDKEISALERKAKRMGLKPAVRLNGLSDLRWELIAPQLFENHPDVKFYDYTKDRIRYTQSICHAARKALNLLWPKNYTLTFSAGQSTTDGEIAEFLEHGGNVAIVYHGEIPKSFMFGLKPYMVIDGDKNDLRFLDSPGEVVGLKAKGALKKAKDSTFAR